MNIEISDEKSIYEFNNVPQKVAKAIITILKECANDETGIIDSVRENIDKEK